MFRSLFSLSLSLSFCFAFWQSLCTQPALPSFCTPFYATLFTAFVVSLSLVSFYVFVNKLWQKNFSPSSEMRFWCCSSLGTPFHSLFHFFSLFTLSFCLPLSLSVCFVCLFALCRWKTLSILSCLQLCDIQRIASDLPRPTPTYSSHCTSPLHSPHPCLSLSLLENWNNFCNYFPQTKQMCANHATCARPRRPLPSAHAFALHLCHTHCCMTKG